MAHNKYEMTMQGQPRGPVPVTSTVINMQPEVSEPDHIVWSLFNTMFFNVCCLGFMAFAYSVKSRDRKLAGDITGAKNYASTAKIMNVTALILGCFFYFVVIFTPISSSCRQPFSVHVNKDSVQ
ncbi:interferon-induced transmembrane protein 2-like [Suncus etruscus]|uniref:interferon-induced transmembrane protein 2-like n=1 Tax=Suncus etruscus TaxID=109475 RepID=UPI00210F5EDA|nr:interferon-induced transmembrane protein 2-like [Suncus etruscus]